MKTNDSILQRHVWQSNLIERIVAFPGTPLYDSHLAAARLVERGEIIHPNVIHDVLADGVSEMASFRGRYRTCDVDIVNSVDGNVIARSHMPRWEVVPGLMKEWEGLVQDFVAAKKVDREAFEFLHTWLLSIHPYQDGNGRTARLVWNMLRRNKGLSWHIEHAHSKTEYYARIRKISDGLFRQKHANAYR